METFATVGYTADFNDRNYDKGINPYFMSFILLVQFIGILIFGYWTTSIRMHIGYFTKRDIIAKKTQKIDIWLTKLSNVDNDHKKDYESFSIIRDYLVKKFTENQFVLMDNKIFKYIKPQSKKKLITHIFKDYEKKFRIIFNYAEPSFFPEFLLNSRLVKFIKGTTIIKKGEKSDNFYLITLGSIDVFLPYKNLELNITELPQYSFFGENLVLNNLISKFNYK